MVDIIDKSSGPGSIGGARPVEPSHADRSRPAKPQDASQQPRTDRATISPNAAEVARYQEMAQLHSEAFGPADRSTKLEEVRERLAAGYYDRDEVLDKIAGSIVEGATADQVRASDLDVAKRRTREGFYDKPEVMDKTVENVLQHVLGRTSDE